MTEKLRGPVEDTEWPGVLTARVTEPGEQPRLHGYDVQGDLARGFTFGEVVLTALSGEAPARDAGRAFDAAMVFLVPVSIGEAPAHAASVAQMCGTRTAGVLGVAALGLAEHARTLLDRHAPLCAWLASPEGPFPDAARAASDSERDAVGRLRAAIAPFDVPALSRDPSLEAALLAVLFACGLRTRARIEAALVVARLAGAAAEALATPLLAFREYPMELPRYRYEAKR